jgi:hypothetical protein
MAHVWREKYSALYNRTYRILYDAGINEELADELATQRTLAAALTSCEKPFQVSFRNDRCPATALRYLLTDRR